MRSPPHCGLGCCPFRTTLHSGIQQVDAIDLQIEVRSGTLRGLGEVTVLDDLGITGVSLVGIDVGQVGGDVTVSVDLQEVDLEGVHSIISLGGEGGAVEDMQLTALQLGNGGIDSFLSAGSGNISVQLGQNHGAGSQSAGPVSVDSLAIDDALDRILIVGSPVDAGRNDVGVGAGLLGGAVVGDVGNLGVLASRWERPGSQRAG